MSALGCKHCFQISLGSKHFSWFTMFVFPPVLCYSHHTPPVLMRSSSAFHVLSLLQPKIVSCVCLGPVPILYLCMEHQMVSIPNWFITWGKCQGKLSVTNTVSTATVTTLRHFHPLMICSRLRKALGMIWKSCLSHVWQPETQCGRERMLMQRICEWYPAH